MTKEGIKGRKGSFAYYRAPFGIDPVSLPELDLAGTHPVLARMSVKLLLQTTQGIIRDQAVRRVAMFVIVIAALLMLFAGVTFLAGWLEGDRWVFLIYWVVCAWLTMTAILLAIFDLIAVRLLLRRERRKMKHEVFGREERDGKD